MKSRQIEISIILLAMTIFDAARDAVMIIMSSSNIETLFISNFLSWSPTQWIWHLLKWAALYIPAIYLIYLAKFNWKDIIMLALLALVIWNLTYMIILDPEPPTEIFQTGQ